MPIFDQRDKDHYVTFTRRTFAIGGGITAVFAVLAGRLCQLQIYDGAAYLAEAEHNRTSRRLVMPRRGRILDRFGVEIANSRANYRISLLPELAPAGPTASLGLLSDVIQISDAEKQRALREIAQNQPFVPVLIAENLSWEQFSRICMQLPYLPGMQADIGELRNYPFGVELAHIVGYVATVTPGDKTGDSDPLLDLPGYRIGKSGIEKQFEKTVRGKAGISRVEINAYGRDIRFLGKEPSEPGEDVWLTIDNELQNFVVQRLNNESAACIVTDVNTGDIIALASTPGFDPNLFTLGITSAQWRSLIVDDHKPLLNKAIGGIYPPGSTFKPVVAAAAVDCGLATLDYRVICTGSITIGEHTFHCWQKKGHGSLDLKGGIKNSCDVFFYETARLLGIDNIHNAALKLGLGMPTGVELPGEHSGLIPSQKWKQTTYGTTWQQGDTLSAGIGQGYVTVTPLQLALQVTRIASGRNISPRLVHVAGPEIVRREIYEPLHFAHDALARVREGMIAVTNEPGGTAYAYRISEPGFEMAGKTGTAQVRAYSQAEYARGITKNSDLEWKLRDHGLFIGFAPIHAPRYACACIVEHGSDGHPQVLMARDILLFAQKRDPTSFPAAYPMRSVESNREKVSG